jgi:hypothetical protein
MSSRAQGIADLKKYLWALPDDQYNMNYLQRRLGKGEVVDSQQKRKNLRRWQYTSQQILDKRPEAVRANYGPAKRDIFCRPADPKYISIDLDDVESDLMDKAMSMKPALIVESSEDKFQVWYKTQATTPQENKAAWSYVNAVLGGDPGAAGHTQLWRLPGFPNRKKGRENFQARVLYSDDYVIGQSCSFRVETPSNAKRPARSSQPSSNKKARKASSGVDGSQFDFVAVKEEIRASRFRITDPEITENLRLHSRHHGNREPASLMTGAFADCCRRTTKAARTSLKKKNERWWTK